jgi:hypothetical protein
MNAAPSRAATHHGGYSHILLSDLAKIESYKVFKDMEHARVEAAKAAWIQSRPTWRSFPAWQLRRIASNPFHGNFTPNISCKQLIRVVLKMVPSPAGLIQTLI